MDKHSKSLIEAGSTVKLLRSTKFPSHTFKKGDVVTVKSVGIKKIADLMYEEAIVYVPLRANHYPLPLSMLELTTEAIK